MAKSLPSDAIGVLIAEPFSNIVSVESHLSRFSLLTLGHSLRCLSRARRHSAFCFALRRPAGFGFQKIFWFKSPHNERTKDFPNLPKKHAAGLGSGAHSRRFAQE